MTGTDPAGRAWLPLQGLRVLDFTFQLPGPLATLYLADLGADVVKVEPPSGDPARRMFPDMYRAANRNKRSVVLDLKKKEARPVIERLASRADVAIEGFRVGVAERLGVDYRAMAARNPDLVYCSLSGYGQTGPDRLRPGHDLNFLARSGALSLSGHWGQKPCRSGLPIADMAGSGFAAIAILAALRERRSTGRGAFLDVSLAETTVSLAAIRHGLDFDGQNQGHLFPTNDLFETADGERIGLGVVEQRFWDKFVKAAGNLDPELGDSRYTEEEGRLQLGDELSGRLREVMRLRPAAEWMRLFERYDVPAELVVTPAVASRSPQMGAREMVMEKEGERHMPFPIRVDGRRGASLRWTAPTLGAHTDDVLGELGFDPAEIAGLREAGVFGLETGV